jgi:formyltetrahydrofolate deformylase
MPTGDYALTFACPDRPGIVAAITGALFKNDANILEAQHYTDSATDEFFARICFNFSDVDRIQQLRVRLSELASELQMQWTIRDLADRQRLLIMVSRMDHCLADLIYRWRTGELAVDIAGIISNHPRDTFQLHDLEEIPFNYLPILNDTKHVQEQEIWRIVKERKVDLVVLARYMQILSSDLSAKLFGRCINIHHSFLPGFKGARPYHQAHARGVKVIGATAHYVTEDLDEGPIIEQDVERISHYDTPEALVRKGRDIERRVLSRAVHWHVSARVLLNGRKTVVFRD